MSICEFCHAYLNGLLWQQTTFNCDLLPEKEMDNSFKVTFVANGQLLALITPGWLATGNFHLDSFNGLNQRKFTF
jgi:hypothetical protein